MQNAVARRHCEECVLGPETLTNRHAIGLVGMEQSRFQDRCLKPLGHPSAPTTSNTYALPLAEQISHCRQLATACPRLSSRGRALFGPALSQMSGGHHRKARAIGSGLIDGPALVPFRLGHFQDTRAEKENPAEVRGKSQVRRMSGQLGDWGNRKAVQPALRT